MLRFPVKREINENFRLHLLCGGSVNWRKVVFFLLFDVAEEEEEED